MYDDVAIEAQYDDITKKKLFDARLDPQQIKNQIKAEKAKQRKLQKSKQKSLKSPKAGETE